MQQWDTAVLFMSDISIPLNTSLTKKEGRYNYIGRMEKGECVCVCVLEVLYNVNAYIGVKWHIH